MGEEKRCTRRISSTKTQERSIPLSRRNFVSFISFSFARTDSSVERSCFEERTSRSGWGNRNAMYIFFFHRRNVSVTLRVSKVPLLERKKKKEERCFSFSTAKGERIDRTILCFFQGEWDGDTIRDPKKEPEVRVPFFLWEGTHAHDWCGTRAITTNPSLTRM